jgi:hypothetical protein
VLLLLLLLVVVVVVVVVVVFGALLVQLGRGVGRLRGRGGPPPVTARISIAGDIHGGAPAQEWAHEVSIQLGTSPPPVRVVWAHGLQRERVHRHHGNMRSEYHVQI